MLIETSTRPDVAELKGFKFYARFDKREKSIVGRCLVDMNNEPCFYTTHKRGVQKAFAALENALLLNPDLTHSQAMQVLHSIGIRYHYWCAVD